MIEEEQKLINSLSTEKLFEITLKFSNSPKDKEFIERNFEAIIARCSFDYDIYIIILQYYV